jgi:cytochrome c peroxidase
VNLFPNFGSTSGVQGESLVRTIARCLGVCFSLAVSLYERTFIIPRRQPLDPHGQPDAPDPLRVALGAEFFDNPIFSSRYKRSCTPNHGLTHGGTINMARTVGYDGRSHRFNASAIFNVGVNYGRGWRGDLTTLEDKNDGVLGRFTLTSREPDIGVFSLPSPRDGAVTAPHFEDSRVQGLSQAVDVMAANQPGRRRLTPCAVKLIVSFLQIHGRIQWPQA